MLCFQYGLSVSCRKIVRCAINSVCFANVGSPIIVGGKVIQIAQLTYQSIVAHTCCGNKGLCCKIALSVYCKPSERVVIQALIVFVCGQSHRYGREKLCRIESFDKGRAVGLQKVEAHNRAYGVSCDIGNRFIELFSAPKTAVRLGIVGKKVIVKRMWESIASHTRQGFVGIGFLNVASLKARVAVDAIIPCVLDMVYQHSACRNVSVPRGLPSVFQNKVLVFVGGCDDVSPI